MEKRITDFLIRNGNAKEEERELIEFGLKQGAISAFSWACVFVVGFLFNMLLETFVFSIAFSQLRKYVGGYHTRSQITCYFFSMFSITGVLYTIKYVALNDIYLLAFGLIACIIIVALAPLGDENKELDELEIKIYGRRGKLVLLIEVILAIMFFIVHQGGLYRSIVLSILAVSVSLLIAKLKKG